MKYIAQIMAVLNWLHERRRKDGFGGDAQWLKKSTDSQVSTTTM